MANGNGKHESESHNEPPALKPRQEMAARELASGKGVVEAARAAGVNRTTLYRWMLEPEFVAWLNRWQAVVTNAVRCQFLAAATDAAAKLTAVAREDEKTAAVLLRGMGMLAGTPAGSGDPQVVARQIEVRKRGDLASLDRRDAELDDYEADTATGNFGATGEATTEDEDELDDPGSGDESADLLRQRVLDELKARRALAAAAEPAPEKTPVLPEIPHPNSVPAHGDDSLPAPNNGG